MFPTSEAQIVACLLLAAQSAAKFCAESDACREGRGKNRKTNVGELRFLRAAMPLTAPKLLGKWSVGWSSIEKAGCLFLFFNAYYNHGCVRQIRRARVQFRQKGNGPWLLREKRVTVLHFFSYGFYRVWPANGRTAKHAWGAKLVMKLFTW